MTTNAQSLPEAAYLLSREEVLAILHLTNLPFIPNLGDEPLPNISNEQLGFGLIVAERALRARGLALINPEGRLLIESGLLQLIGVCAIARRSLFITRIESPRGVGVQMIAHQHDPAWVVHSRPDSVLHAFQAFPDWQRWMAEVVQFCQWPVASEVESFTLNLPKQTLEQVRQQIADDHVAAAKATLLALDAADPVAVDLLIEILSQPHTVVVIQHAFRSDPDTLALQSITTLQQGNRFLVAVEPDTDADHFVIQPASVDQLESLLRSMLAA